MKLFNKIKKIFKKNNNQKRLFLEEIKRTLEEHKKACITEELLDQYNIWKFLIVNYNIKYDELSATFVLTKKKDYSEEIINDLSDITAICVDYDGYRTTKGLKSLIADIRDYTNKLIKKWENK